MFYKDIGLKFAKVKEYFKNKPDRQAEIMCVKNLEIDYNYNACKPALNSFENKYVIGYYLRIFTSIFSA